MPPVSSFATALDAATKTRRYTCAVTRMRADLKTDADRRDFDKALTSPADEVTSAAIARAMVSLDITASQGMIQRHRRGQCSCARGNA